MGAMAMKGFWALRASAYTKRERSVEVMIWDGLRVVAVVSGFALGVWIHQGLLEDKSGSAGRLMVAITTMGTFLASFVLSIMGATGNREMDLVERAVEATMIEDRLSWLLSDQLIMVVFALTTAGSGIAWLTCFALGASHPALTGLVFAVASLSIVNGIRLPILMWELNRSAIRDERDRAFNRINDKIEEQRKEALK